MKKPIAILLFTLLTHAYGQKFATLEKVLVKEFPESSTTDGRWVFYPDKANIEKIDKLLVKSQIPHYDFYKARLTNYLGYHVNEATCLLLYDSLRSKAILVKPLWYSGISGQLLDLFIGKKFSSKDSLLAFLGQLHELMEVGSSYRFVNTAYADDLISYDLVYSNGDTYTTGGNGVSSTVRYNQDGVWRQISVEIKNLKLMRYTAVNLKTGDKEVIK